jgi:hypothetical protein
VTFFQAARMLSGGGKLRRRLTAYAGLLALLVQALLPLSDALYHARHGAEPGDRAALASVPSPDTPSGGQQDDDSSDPHKGIHLLGAGVLPMLALVVSWLILFFVFDPIWHDRLLARRRAVFAQARAPPIPV